MSVLNDKLLLEIGDLLATHYEESQPKRQDSPGIAFGRYLRATRRWRGLSIPALAEKSGVAESEILAYEHGIIPETNIDHTSLRKLAQTLEEDLTSFTLLLGFPLKPSGVTPHLSPGPSQPRHRFWMKLFTVQGGKLPYLAPAFVTVLLVCLVLSRSLPGPIPEAQPLVQNAAPTLRPTAFTQRAFAEQPAPTGQQRGGYQGQLQTAPGATVSQPHEHLLAGPLPPILHIDYRMAFALQSIILNLDDLVTSSPVASGSPHESRLMTTPAGGPVANIDEALLQLAQPLTHTVAAGENVSCLASKYYGNPDYYPIICLNNSGDSQCSAPLRDKSVIVVPVFAELEQTKQQLLEQLSTPLVTGFKTLSREMVNTNKTERLRGIDYFCQNDDYQNFGEQLVLAGAIKNPEQRIPGWSSAGG